MATSLDRRQNRDIATLQSEVREIVRMLRDGDVRNDVLRQIAEALSQTELVNMTEAADVQGHVQEILDDSPVLTSPQVNGKVTKKGTAGLTSTPITGINEDLNAVYGLTDDTAEAIFNFTVPNVKLGMGVEILATGILGDGDSLATAKYLLSISRVEDAATQLALSSKLDETKTTGASGNAALTVAVTAVAGDNDAEQTFSITGKVTKSAGSSDSHAMAIEVRAVNFYVQTIEIGV